MDQSPPRKLVLNDRQLCDLEMLLNGAFSPLDTFMNEEDYTETINNCRLKNGAVWPIPIVLHVPTKEFRNNNNNNKIDLLDCSKRIVAELEVSNIFKPDIEKECLGVFSTFDNNHPYVKYLISLGDVLCVSGKLKKKEEILHFDFLDYRISPQKLKELNGQYQRVLGFQTRNPMHNCHYYLSLLAYNQIESDNKILNLMPTIGVTQDDDVEYHVRVRCYLHILEKYKGDKINIRLCLIPLAMRMAGPREALWHAIIRKNYGCTDFVVGRDHAGPSSRKKDGSNFYGPTEAHEFVRKYENEIGINVIKSDILVYDNTIGEYVTEDKCISKNMLSGTELRKKLKNKEKIPEWFTMPEISKELTVAYNSGICFYLIGLSGSGKTTISSALNLRLQEKYNNITLLDGDIIREHLGQGLGFSKKDRSINVRRIGYVASLLVKSGGIVICSNIAPYDEDRLYNRGLISKNGKYIEIYINTPIEICEKRDVKGLYNKARNGEISNLTGLSDPFEEPTKSDITISGEGDINLILDKIISLI